MEQPSCQHAQWKEEQLKLQNELPTSFSQQQQTSTASAAAAVHFWVDVMVNQSTSAWLSLLELLKSLWAASWNAAVDAGDATNQLSQALSVSPHTLPISSVQLSDEPIANISNNAGCSAHCSILSATETPNLTAVVSERSRPAGSTPLLYAPYTCVTTVVHPASNMPTIRVDLQGTTVPRPYASMAIFLLAAFLGLPHAWEAVKRKRQRSMEEQAILAANGRNLLKQKKVCIHVAMQQMTI